MTKARDLADGVINTSELADGSITTAKINDDAITAGKINVTGNGTAGQVLSSDGDGSMTWADSASPFAYNAVTGTTPSLDVGTYNFFDNGTLSGNTTLSFTNVPTEAKWQYTAKGAVGTSFDLGSGWSVDAGQVYTNTGVTSSSYDFTFNNDGTKLFLHSYSDNRIYRCPLLTAYDLTTVQAADQHFAYNTNTAAATGVTFKPDGTIMYLLQNSAPTSVEQYNLSTAYDLTTASYSSTFNISTQVPYSPYALDFSSDGTKFYAQFQTTIYQYNMSTAWSVSTASYASKSLNAGTGGTYPLDNPVLGIQLDNTGTILLALGYTVGSQAHIKKWTLGTAYDISTASFDSDVNIGAIAPYGIFATADGQKIFYSDYGNQKIYRATSGAFATVTLPASVQNSADATAITTERVTYDFYTADGGTNVYLIGEELI